MKKLYTICSILLMYAYSLNAQEYAANHLQAAGQKLNLSTQLTKGAVSDTLSIQGQRIIVRKDSQGRVEHIGIPLFNAYIRSLQPSPIYDYLEYAALDKKFHISENTLQFNKLKFNKGNWDTLFLLGDTTTCNISNLGDKTYIVQWIKGGNVFLDLSFPVDYELLANSSRREMEVRFIKELKNFKTQDSRHEQAIDSTILKKYAVQGIYVKEGSNYAINAITSNTYYTKKNGKHQLLYDSAHPSESMSNLLLSPAALPEAHLKVNFAMSTYREETVDTDYRQFFDFCIANGCEPFFGYEGMVDGMASGTLIMHNKKSGYNHIFYIQCPVQQIGQKGAQLKGTGYIFTPTSNVKDLFAAPSKGRSKSYKYIAK